MSYRISTEVEYVIVYNSYWGRKEELVSITHGGSVDYDSRSIMDKDFAKIGICDTGGTLGLDNTYEIRTVYVQDLNKFINSGEHHPMVVKSIRNEKLIKIL